MHQAQNQSLSTENRPPLNWKENSQVSGLYAQYDSHAYNREPQESDVQAQLQPAPSDILKNSSRVEEKIATKSISNLIFNLETHFSTVFHDGLEELAAETQF